MKKIILTIAALTAFAANADAQSLFSTHGLGTTLDGVDARARAIGVNGVGLIGLSTTLLNPAEQGGTVRRGLTATIQPWSANADVANETDRIGGTRFPLMQVMYPYNRITFTLGYAGVLDQSWAVVADDTMTLGTERVATNDVVQQTGGINEIKLGAAYYVNSRLSVGLAIGANTGNIDRTLTRSFPDSGSTLLGFQTRSRWAYSGALASVGVRFDPTRATRVSASVTMGGTLTAKPDTLGVALTEYKYDMPTRFAFGASSQLSRNFLLAASATIAKYGDGNYAAPGTTQQTVAQQGLDVGGGIEYEGLRGSTRVYPIRLGAHYSKLPFHNPNESAPKEVSGSAGMGLRLAQDDYGPLAVFDIAVERGKREGWTSTVTPGGLTEKFWRITASLSLFGR